LKDGSTPLWTHIEAITDSDERETCRAVVVDISERKQAEEKIRTMNAKLEQRVEERTRELREAQDQLVLKEKLAVLGQLASGMGHELRNPLAVINNAIYYLNLVQPDADEKVREYHGTIKQEVQNTERIINDLLDFERAGSADPEPVSVTELVQRVLERHPTPPSVKVTLELPADLPKIYADSRQMKQTLGYLVINAYQSMKDSGELVISSQCSVIHEKSFVSIHVHDNGTGITPENMQRIFEPLFTTKSKGLGLGLAISKKFVEANDGRIEVESEAGKGSTFTVYLPESKRNHTTLHQSDSA
jgi:signal transduction histidine kinase